MKEHFLGGYLYRVYREPPRKNIASGSFLVITGRIEIR